MDSPMTIQELRAKGLMVPGYKFKCVGSPYDVWTAGNIYSVDSDGNMNADDDLAQATSISTFVLVETDGEDKKTKSDGGPTDYYKLPEHATELRHLISAKGMSKARGDIFKACYRLGEKDGTDILYDLNKMKFFVEDLIEMYERGEHL